MTHVVETHVPAESVLHAMLPDADFYDAHKAPLIDGSLTPTDIFVRTVGDTPDWVSSLMAIRNGIVSWIGLKDVGGMRPANDRPASDYVPGERLGIFNVLTTSDTELLLGIDDSHLDVRVSVLKQVDQDEPSYVVSTVVNVHNWLGRAYMVPVGRIHPVVVRSIMRRVVV